MRVTAGLPHTHRREAAARDDTSTESRTEEEETAGVRGQRKAARPAARKWRVAEAGDRGKEEGGGRGGRAAQVLVLWGPDSHRRCGSGSGIPKGPEPVGL